MKEERKTIQIEDAVYLTDPCYDITTWCQDLLHNVKSGTWVIDYEYNEYEDGTEQDEQCCENFSDGKITNHMFLPPRNLAIITEPTKPNNA